MPDPLPLCYFFEKKDHFLKCCIFSESHQIIVTLVLIFGSSPHCARKCMAKLYAVYIAGAWQSLRKNRSLNCQLICNSVIQIHSFCLVRYYAGLALIFLVFMAGEADGQDFFLPKTSVQLHAFECIIQSTNI